MNSCWNVYNAKILRQYVGENWGDIGLLWFYVESMNKNKMRIKLMIYDYWY